MKKLIALILLFACILGLAGCKSKEEKALLEAGPWGSQAIWTDERGQIYLICTKQQNDSEVTVTAYLDLALQWQAMECSLRNETVAFQADGQTILTAAAKMDGEKLYLSDFQISTAGFSSMYLNLELTKFPYEEKIGELPFQIKK